MKAWAKIMTIVMKKWRIWWLLKHNQRHDMWLFIEDCMKNLCKDLREHKAGIINCKKKKILLWTKQNKKWYKQKLCYICKKEFTDYDDDKKYCRVQDHDHYTRKYRGVVYDICNLRYKTTT